MLRLTSLLSIVSILGVFLVMPLSARASEVGHQFFITKIGINYYFTYPTELIGNLEEFPTGTGNYVSYVRIYKDGVYQSGYDIQNNWNIADPAYFDGSDESRSLCTNALGAPSDCTADGVWVAALYNNAGTVQLGYAKWIVTGGSSEPENPVSNTITRIDTVAPPDGTTVATTSLPVAVGATGYVNEDDYKEGARLRIKVDRNTDQQAVGALMAFQSAAGNYTSLPIGSSGSFDLSTTTLNTQFPVDRIGLYRVKQEVQVPGIGVHFWIINWDITWNTLVSTSTTFKIGTSTAVDVIQEYQAEYLETVLEQQGDPLAGCQFSWFDTAIDFSLTGALMGCMTGLTMWAFVPSPMAVEQQFTDLREGFLARAPWGYGTRFYDIASSISTTSLPSLVITVPDDMPGSGAAIDLTPWDDLLGDDSILGTTESDEGHTLRDIVEPGLMTLVYALLGIAIVHRVIAFEHGMHGSNGGHSRDTHSSKRT